MSNQFQMARDGRLSMPLYYDVDLSVKRDDNDPLFPPLVLNIAANSFFVDQDVANGGIATVTFQDTSFGATAAPFTVSPGFTTKITFTQIKIENAAQAGKKLRFFYGVDLSFDPGQSGVVTLAGGVSILQGTSFVENGGTVTTGGVSQLFLPADPDRIRFVIRNGATLSGSYLYIGGPLIGIGGAIRIDAGQTWIETDAAAAAWYIISASSAHPFSYQEISK